MDVCEILIVEDDDSAVDGWKRDIREFNRGTDIPFKFVGTFATTKQQALTILRRTRMDCAVIDLRLPEGDTDVDTGHPLGNDVLEVLLQETGIPAVVYSGYDKEVSENVKSSNIRVYGKQGGITERILNEFAEQANLMAAMEITRNNIGKETARLFNQSIWTRWEDRWSSDENTNIISEVITRQTASHVASSLSPSGVYHHPDEFYTVPALSSDRLDTGDLLELDTGVHIILTPRCNMANKMPTYFILAVCTEIEGWRAKLNGSNKERERAAKELKLHATQGHAIASHFLPPLDGRGPWIVDFQEMRAIESKETSDLVSKRFASVAPHFVPNLVQRYSTYLGRIGQPDIDTEILIELCRS